MSRPSVSSRKPEVMQYNHSGRTNTPVIAYAPTGVLKPRKETFIYIYMYHKIKKKCGTLIQLPKACLFL